MTYYYPWGKIHGGNCLEGLCYKGNYLKVIAWRAKVSEVIVLGGSFIGCKFLWARSLGVNFPGGISWG